MRFTDKVVLITGASGGIGTQVVKRFASEGAKIVLVGRTKEKLEKTAKDLELKSDAFLIVAGDVTKESDVENYVTKTKEHFGRIDVFVNNAGIESKFESIMETDSDAMSKVLDVNLKGVYFGLKHVLKVMTSQKFGSIINTSSVAGLIGFPNMAPYVASKHAVIGLTKTAALEVASYNVRVNAICPAPVDTQMMEDIEEAGGMSREDFASAVPLGRYAKPEEIASLIAFLASDDASYITGSAYPIDGAMTSS
ncbi:MAG: SDR family oxidoreductase [Clostridiales bacterium]|nr:SDR family oxidoreductase [Clostridiales bacterium]